MAEQKESTEQEYTHNIVAVPREDGTYKDPNGKRVDLYKFKKEKELHTKHPTFKGTTIGDFVKQSNYKKA
ncbi:hypothetical protein [Fodinibius sp.]|uniref:hypothetical protein n=1 Tax=Fodinibius sp. TaxID=1872440 RepID=UPI002ACE1ACE|nr:hypothetical protein [Fodinibius sp.]MDZ7658087.1 hypothetical protein [Fodinibius sp.]